MTFDELLNLPPLRKVRGAKKAKPVPGKYDLRQLYYDARRVMFEREYPAAWKAGEYFDNKMPDITTTNGTTRYIEDVLNNMGHQAERVNTQGNYTKDGWRTSGSTKGSTDLHCNIKVPSQALPVSWKIEIKNQDSMSKAQLKYQAKMKAVGVLHSVVYVGGLDGFWDELNRILTL